MSEAGAEGLVEELRERWEATDAPVAKKINRLLKLAKRAADALEANARALAEAGAEIERLRKERDHWKFGHDASERQRDEALEALRGAVDRAFEDAKFAAAEMRPKNDRMDWTIYAKTRDACVDGVIAEIMKAQARALAVLENSKAGLADANTKSLSQDQEIAGLREELRRKDAALRMIGPLKASLENLRVENMLDERDRSLGHIATIEYRLGEIK